MLHAVVAMLLLLVGVAQPDQSGAWLETSPPDNWNVAGATVPLAPAALAAPDPRCGAQERGPESVEEEQLVAAGWRVLNAARVGWGLRVVNGVVDYDGMCRPNQFQAFVFADGQFAGTISPTPMGARADGSGRVVDVFGPDEISAQFVRYAPTDALCCPSATFAVRYAVDGSDAAGPVLVPLGSMRTNPG